jgi:hypothetical protein
LSGHDPAGNLMRVPPHDEHEVTLRLTSDEALVLYIDE